MADKRPALGKGLSALIPDLPEPARPGVLEIDIDLLAPNEDQPRTHLDTARLDELAHSIKASGVIQPIIARRTGSGYRIIAGERRWRAAQRAGLLKVPVILRDIGDDHRTSLEIALVENLQRDDLNPIEEATAYQRLVAEFGLTQEAVAHAVGKDRATVANTIRLLRLPDEVREHVGAGRLGMGHARALLALPDDAERLRVARDIVTHDLSVRETEAIVRKALEPGQTRTTGPAAHAPDANTRAAEDRLKLLLGTRVRIVRRGERGRIEIEFKNEEELIRIYEVLVGSEERGARS